MKTKMILRCACAGLVAGLSFFTVSCDKNDSETTPTEDAILSTSPIAITATKNGGTFTIAVSSNTNWTATSSDTQIATVTPIASSNDRNITVTVSANTTTEVRTATITIAAGTRSASVAVTQEAGTVICTDCVEGGLSWTSISTFPYTYTGKYIDLAQVLDPNTALSLYERIDAIPYKLTITKKGSLNFFERNEQCGTYLYDDLANVGKMSNTDNHGLVNHGDNGGWNPPCLNIDVEPGTYYLLVYYRREDKTHDPEEYECDFEIEFNEE